MVKSMIDQWEKQMRQASGNFTTNEAMPEELISKLLEEDSSLKDQLLFDDVDFPKLGGVFNDVDGLDILAGLQRIKRNNCSTLFRVMRCPTYKRMHEMVSQSGYAFSNYEQERIMDLYQNEAYIQKREEIKTDNHFWTQPQERVVPGLPLFCLVNDALQIHRAYRGDVDMVAMAVIHIPYELLTSGRIKLIANAAIDLDQDNNDRDFLITDFKKDGGGWDFDYKALRTCGIDLHEMYSRDLPWSIKEADQLGIEQEFFQLDIYRLSDQSKIERLKQERDSLKEHSYFLHGFFGDQNVFGRRCAEYLPSKGQKIRLKNES